MNTHETMRNDGRGADEHEITNEAKTKKRTNDRTLCTRLSNGIGEDVVRKWPMVVSTSSRNDEGCDDDDDDDDPPDDPVPCAAARLGSGSRTGRTRTKDDATMPVPPPSSRRPTRVRIARRRMGSTTGEEDEWDAMGQGGRESASALSSLLVAYDACITWGEGGCNRRVKFLQGSSFWFLQGNRV